MNIFVCISSNTFFFFDFVIFDYQTLDFAERHKEIFWLNLELSFFNLFVPIAAEKRPD